MAGVLSRMPDGETSLLLYVAGELPEAERLAMERRLAEDAALRERLDATRHLYEGTLGCLAELDAGEALSSGEQSIRRVMREMRRRSLELAARPAVPERLPARRHWPRGAVPAAAAAAVVFLLIGLWGLDVLELPNGGAPGGAGVAAVDPGGPDSEDPARVDPVVADLQRSFAGATGPLDDADQHLQALWEDSPFLGL